MKNRIMDQIIQNIFLVPVKKDVNAESLLLKSLLKDEPLKRGKMLT